MSFCNDSSTGVERRPRECLSSNFGRNRPLAQVPLVCAADAELGRALFRPDDGEGGWGLLLEPLWALPWAVAWFAHDLDDFGALAVLWDRLLATAHVSGYRCWFCTCVWFQLLVVPVSGFR